MEEQLENPISPDDISDNKEKYIHQTIIKTVNKILKERYNLGSTVDIKISEISKPFFEAHPEIDEDKAWKAKMFDIEDAYRKFGWKVSYDRPGWDESYEGFYKFSKGAKK